MSNPEREVRFNAASPIELRADGDDGLAHVVGYAAVFGQETDIGGYWREVIAPGAFSEALKRGDDTTFLINHRGLPLARTSSKTLLLSEDGHGLRVETDLDTSDPDVQRVLPKMKRGDLSKMSFAFRAVHEEWDETGDTPLRTIHEVELFDVSIVTDPAYEGTEIGLRSRQAALKLNDSSAIQRRMRMRLRLTESN